VQEGIERPIAYASRQMNKPERSYSALEAGNAGARMGSKTFSLLFVRQKVCGQNVSRSPDLLKEFWGS